MESLRSNGLWGGRIYMITEQLQCYQVRSKHDSMHGYRAVCGATTMRCRCITRRPECGSTCTVHGEKYCINACTISKLHAQLQGYKAQ